MAVMTNKEFALILIDIAKNYKTLYIMGCFGAPMMPKNKIRYTQNNPYNKTPERTAMIKNASEDTFGFDCVGLVKGVLWGWCGDPHRTYGGAGYAVNGVPDTDAKKMLNYCTDVSKKWDYVEIGEYLWMDGHCGVYVGDGLAVECTPKWDNKVQITAVGNLGAKEGFNTRTWTKHGRLQFIDYKVPNAQPIRYAVQRGDNLTKIAKKFGTTVAKLVEVNGIQNPNKIYVGQVLTIV